LRKYDKEEPMMVFLHFAIIVHNKQLKND